MSCGIQYEIIRNFDLMLDCQVEVGIVRQFPFSSALQRMGVLCKEMGKDEMHFFCKGSPEMIQSLSLPETGKVLKNKINNFSVDDLSI